MVRKPLESHFYLTQAYAFVSKSAACENRELRNPISRYLLFKDSVFLMCLNLVASSLLMEKKTQTNKQT